MTETFPTSVLPSFGTSKKVTNRILENNFGDGYTVRAVDGLNSKRDEWTVVFNNIIDSDVTTILDFLEARRGFESFNWTPPLETTSKLFSCKEWQVTPTGYNNSSIRATFKQEFDL
jgi:phage-related protein